MAVMGVVVPENFTSANPKGIRIPEGLVLLSLKLLPVQTCRLPT
jgi:hypothetical protein